MRLDLAYDGTGFRGWAAQADSRTVQGELEAALGVLLRADPPRLTVAGRTDAGVHARGQVAHVDLPELDPLLLRRLNGLLPPDVRVLRTSPAPDGFDARFSALSRTYRYRVADGPEAVDPLRRDVLAWPRPLDLAALQAASPALLGEHDFAAYCKRREGASTVRALLDLAWERSTGGLLVLTIRADAFCHSMVRSLVGAMLAVGEGRREAGWPGLAAGAARAGHRRGGRAGARPGAGARGVPAGRRAAVAAGRHPRRPAHAPRCRQRSACARAAAGRSGGLSFHLVLPPG